MRLPWLVGSVGLLMVVMLLFIAANLVLVLSLGIKRYRQTLD